MEITKTLREIQKLQEADQSQPTPPAAGQPPAQSGQQGAAPAQNGGADAQALAKAVQDAVKAAIEPLAKQISELAQAKQGGNEGGDQNASKDSGSNNSGDNNSNNANNSGDNSSGNSNSGGNNSSGDNNTQQQKESKLFNNIYYSAKLNEGSFGDWHSKQVARAAKEPTVVGRIGKYIGNVLFGGDNWDDLSDAMEEYMSEPGISKAEKMSRVNQVSSVFRKFDGRKEVFSDEQIANAEND